MHRSDLFLGAQW